MSESVSSKENIGYQFPPKAIADLIDAPPTPGLSISPSNEWLLFLDRPSLPGIEEVAQEELRLAGIRINPKTNSQSQSSPYQGIKLKHIKSQKEITIEGLPKNPRIENISWSRNSQRIGFTIGKADGLELWFVEIATGAAKKITAAIINDAMAGLPFRWLSDSKNILYKSIVDNRGSVPEASRIPDGPVIQFNEGTVAPVRTYQDLLKNPHDEAVFEYYTATQLMVVDIETGAQKKIGPVDIVKGFAVAPDSNYVLVLTIQKPFSYLVPYSRFPFDVVIYDLNGNLIKKMFTIPLAENIPKGFGAVREGARSFAWRGDRPASLYWIEAQDGGDPKNEVAIRDQTFYLEAPFSGTIKKSIGFELRYGGITWGNDDTAICYEWWWQNRKEITSKWCPEAPAKGKTILFDRSWEDRYNDPGAFETKLNKYGRYVLMSTHEGTTFYLKGQGASEAGNRPFVDTFDMNTKETKRLWRSEAPYYEVPSSIINDHTVLTRRESKEEQPNYFFRNLQNDHLTQITFFEDPHKALRTIDKELIRYQREDGIELTGNLYVPAKYDKEKDGPLPVLMWAYPREFKSADAAGQVKDSPYEFIRIGWPSPLYWVTQGYAIFDDFGMPIIGEGSEEPNETFINQLVSGAAAAVNKLIEMGVADKNRIAVGGHSYGAFMTANLLAHCNLFAAGIARSGAFNRTLTPFGFQSEERTIWEAPDTYIKMSPFMHADKVQTPLLLIHGAADNNSGTYPMQSERFYTALKGHGATVRLVMLPHESHSYRAYESIMHMLYEMTTWLEKYVKNKQV